MSNQQPPLAQKLPSKPNLSHLKNQAKDLLRTGAAKTLSAALFTIARQYNFSSWPKLKEHVVSLTGADELRDAIDRNDVDAVHSLFRKNPTLRKAPIGYAGDGPLTWVSECRGVQTPPTSARLALAKWLIDDGADVHQGGDAPLARAALKGGRAPMMQLLFDEGADVNAAWHGKAPIIFGPCETLDADSLTWLLEHGADANCGTETARQRRSKVHPGTALDYLLATYLRDTPALNACINVLLKAGGQSRHMIPEVMATITGDQATLRDLLNANNSIVKKRYPDLNIGTTGERMLTLRGGTLLHVAAEFGHREIAELLLNAGAEVDATATIDVAGVGGQTAIFHAATQNRDYGLEVVKLLIARGANLKLRCRLPGHYEAPGETVEGNVLEYASRFPGSQTGTIAELVAAGG